MQHWIDNADSYICPVCGFETNNPNRFNCRCPKCGFMDEKDVQTVTKDITSTVEEYMQKQLDKHIQSYDREKARGVPVKMLENIQKKVFYYGAAIGALQVARNIVYCHECCYCGDEDMCPMLSLMQYTDEMDYCSRGVKLI